MRNANTRDIEAVIDSYISANRMFTAFDVTKRLRALVMHVMHADVKKVLDSYNWRSKYTRTLNAQVGAFVYHDPSADPNEYDMNSIPNVPVTPMQMAAQTGTVGMGTGTVVSPTGHVIPAPNVNGLLDKRGRFTISSTHVKSAGFAPYTMVRFETGTRKLVISKVANDSDKNATVDIKNNIRIPRSAFMAAFGRIPSDSELKIGTSRNNIVLFI
jgi:hypothetical protein